MWHNFLALPSVVQIIAWVGSSILAVYAALKAKAIHAALRKVRTEASLRFWKWVGKKAAIEHPQAGNERTYKGEFGDYWYVGGLRGTHFFSVTHDRITTTVQVLETNLFHGVRGGTFVEIDTEPRPGFDYEIVRRVRTHDG
jgi:hypothetical protein